MFKYDEGKCSKLICINTHCELYEFGDKVAPAIFQRAMDTMLSDLDFVIAYLDDILMNSQTVE